MTSEEMNDFPEAWRSVVHPRRHGMIGPEPVPDGTGNLEGRSGKGAAWGGDLAADHERILARSCLDPMLSAAARSGEPSVAADAVRLALATGLAGEEASGNWSVAPVRELAAARGLAHAAAAFVESCAYHLDYVPPRNSRVLVLLRPRESDDSWGVWYSAARHLRSMLAVAPQEVYDETVAALTPLRGGLLRQRIVASYLMPDLREWACADLADLPPGYLGPGGLLFYSAATAGQLSRFWGTRLDHFAAAYDAIGPEAVPLIAGWLARGQWSPDIRRDALDVLTRIPADTVFESLFTLIDVPGVAGGLLAAAERYPARAARMLASRRDDDFIGVLFQRHVRAHPDVPEAALVPRVT
jgi:hypothetical protein